MDAQAAAGKPDGLSAAGVDHVNRADPADREAPTRRRVAIDVRANLALLAVVVSAVLLQLFGLPMLLRHAGLAALWLVIPLVVLAPMHWGLIHEAIHGQLLPQRRMNELVARMLAIAFMLPFDAVRFGHLMHHRFTREPFDRPDVHDGTTQHLRARVRYSARLLGGLYAGELVMPLLAFVPQRYARRLVAYAVGSEGPVGADVQRLFVGFTVDPARRARIRRDWLLSLGLHAITFYLYGAWWPVLLVTMYLRGVWLSLADNLPHYDVRLDEPGRARNFRVPSFWQPVLMNHHLHQLHHRHPTLPWTALPALAHNIAATASNASDTAHAPYFRTALKQFGRFGRVR